MKWRHALFWFFCFVLFCFCKCFRKVHLVECVYCVENVEKFYQSSEMRYDVMIKLQSNAMSNSHVRINGFIFINRLRNGTEKAGKSVDLFFDLKSVRVDSCKWLQGLEFPWLLWNVGVDLSSVMAFQSLLISQLKRN